MPAATLALQGFQAVPWRRLEIAEVTGVMKHVQLAPGLFFNAAEPLDELTQPKSFGR